MIPTHRASPRFPASLRVVFSNAEGFLSEEITNISTEGMFIRTGQPPRLDTLLSAKVTFPNVASPVPFEGKVVHVKSRSRSPRRGSESGFGMRVVRSSEEFRASVDRYIESILRSRPPVVRLISIARGLLQDKGWTQLTAQDTGGNYCLSGALLEAAGEDNIAYEAALRSVGPRLKISGCAAGGFSCHCAVIRWNDAEGRTKGQVIAKLDEVIDAELRGSAALSQS